MTTMKVYANDCVLRKKKVLGVGQSNENGKHKLAFFFLFCWLSLLIEILSSKEGLKSVIP